MNKQPDITKFESMFSGPFPFTSDGVVVGRPSASFEEEMQTMITFAGGEIDTDTLYHENMHQWWGDHVTEGGYQMTFYKEGMATLAEFLFAARTGAGQGGRPGDRGRPPGVPAQPGRHVRHHLRGPRTGSGRWRRPTRRRGGCSAGRPPTSGRASPTSRCGRSSGTANFTRALVQVQQQYGGGSITEPQWEAAFHHWLPSHSAACQQRLSQFFTQWFDTAYPHGGGANRPHITGPGLDGPGFYTGACTR